MYHYHYDTRPLIGYLMRPSFPPTAAGLLVATGAPTGSKAHTSALCLLEAYDMFGTSGSERDWDRLDALCADPNLTIHALVGADVPAIARLLLHTKRLGSAHTAYIAGRSTEEAEVLTDSPMPQGIKHRNPIW